MSYENSKKLAATWCGSIHLDTVSLAFYFSTVRNNAMTRRWQQRARDMARKSQLWSFHFVTWKIHSL